MVLSKPPLGLELHKRDSTRTRAVGDAEAVRQVGQATAEAYAAQANVVGPERLAVLKVLEEASGGNVKITPDVMVNGDGGGGGGLDGGLFNAWLATTLGPKLELPGNMSTNGGPDTKEDGQEPGA